jgi:hypothetical protein
LKLQLIDNLIICANLSSDVFIAFIKAILLITIIVSAVFMKKIRQDKLPGEDPFKKSESEQKLYAA